MAGWIILAVIFIIAVFLHISLHIFVSYNENGLKITADYMGIKLYPRPKKEGAKQKPSLIQKIKNRLKRRKKTSPRKERKDDKGDDDYDYDDIDTQIKDIDLESEEITASIENIEKKKQEEKEETSDEKADVLCEKSIETADAESDENAEDIEDTEDIEKDAESQEKSEEKPNIIGRLQSKYNKIKQKYLVHIPYIWEKLKKTLKAIRIYNIEFEIDSGRLDASQSAVFYGHLNSAVFSFFGALAEVFTMQFKKAQINLKFNEEIFKVRTRFDIYLRPSTFLWILICIGGYFVKEKFIKKLWSKIKSKFRRPKKS